MAVKDTKIHIQGNSSVSTSLRFRVKTACTVDIIEQKIQEAPCIAEKTHKQKDGCDVRRKSGKMFIRNLDVIAAVKENGEWD